MKRIVSVLLAILLLASFIPVNAITIDNDVVTDSVQEVASENNEEIEESIVEESSSEDIVDETMLEETFEEETATEEIKRRADKDSDIADTSAARNTSLNNVPSLSGNVYYGETIELSGNLVSGISGLNSQNVYLSTSTDVTEETKIDEATTYKKSALSQGYFEFSTKVTEDKFPSEGDITLYLVFKGVSGSYNPTSKTFNITIKKPEQTLSAKIKSSSLTRDAKTTLSVTHQYGTTDIEDENISYELYEVTEDGIETFRTSSKSKTFTIDSMDYEVGSHNLFVKSVGSETYEDKTSNTVSFSVSKSDLYFELSKPSSEVSVALGNKLEISGALKESWISLVSIPDQKISVRVDDLNSNPIDYIETTLLGYSKDLSIDLNNFPNGVGTYTLFISYDGTSLYNASEPEEVTLNITKGNAQLSVSDPEVTEYEKTYGDKVNLSGQLIDTKSKTGINGQSIKVRLGSIDGKELNTDTTKTVSGSDGEYSIDVEINEADFPEAEKGYALFICYDDNTNYNASSIEKTVKVVLNQKDTIVSISSDSPSIVLPSGKTTLNVSHHLKDDEKEIEDDKVNYEIYEETADGIKRIDSGYKKSFDVDASKLGEGEHRLFVKSSSTIDYKEATSEEAFIVTVEKATAEIKNVSFDKKLYYNETLTIKGTLCDSETGSGLGAEIINIKLTDADGKVLKSGNTSNYSSSKGQFSISFNVSKDDFETEDTTYDLYIEFEGNDIYKKQALTEKFTVGKIKTTISGKTDKETLVKLVDEISPATIKCTYLDEYGNTISLSGKDISLYEFDESGNKVPVEFKQRLLDPSELQVYPSTLDEGTHEIYIEVKATNKYMSADSFEGGPIVIIVKKAEAKISNLSKSPEKVTYDEEVTISGKLTGILSAPLGNETVKIYVNDVVGEPVATAPTALLNGEFTATFTVDKKNFPEIGTYSLIAYFDGNENYGKVTENLDFEVIPPEIKLTASLDKTALVRPATATLAISYKEGAKDIEDPDVTYSIFEVIDGGEVLVAEGLTDKTYTIDSTEFDEGSHEVIVKASATETYEEAVSEPVTFTVSKTDLKFNLSTPGTKSTKSIGESLLVSGTLTKGVIPVSGETISIRVDDPASEPIDTIQTGNLLFTKEFSIDLDNFPKGIGTYTLYISYDGTDVYNACEPVTRTLEIVKDDTTLDDSEPLITRYEKGYGDTLTLSGHLNSGILSGINDEEIIVRRDSADGIEVGRGYTEKGLLLNGEYNVNIDINEENFPENPKEYTLYICYDGTEYHNAAKPITKTLSVQLIDTKLNVLTPSTILVPERGYGESFSVTGILSNAKLISGGINNQKIEVRLNSADGKVLNTGTTQTILGVDGSFSIDVPVNKDNFSETGEYTLYVCHVPDKGHSAAEPVSRKVEVTKTTATVSCSLDDLIIKRPDGSTTLHVSYKAGDEEIEDTDITYTVYAQGTSSIFEKKPIAESTSKDIEIPAKSLPAGIYNITVKASGNATYSEAESKILDINVLTILKTSTQINGLPLTISDKEYGDYISFVGYLTDDELLSIIPKGINDQTIHIRVGSEKGREIATTTTKKAFLITNGEFSVNIPVNEENFPDGIGTYELYFCFDENDDYYSSNLVREFNLVKTETSVIAELGLLDHIIYRPDGTADLTIHYLDGLKEINDDDITYSVCKVIDGEEITVYEGPEKKVKIKSTDFTPGTYNLRVKASGNDRYEAATSKDLTLLIVDSSRVYINDVPYTLKETNFGDSFVIEGNLEDALLFGDGVNDQIIEAHLGSVDGTLLGDATTATIDEQDGHFIIEVPVTEDVFAEGAKEYTIYITFAGTDDYKATSISRDIFIGKHETTITATLSYGSSVLYRPDEEGKLTISYRSDDKEIKDSDITYSVFEIVDGVEVPVDGPSSSKTFTIAANEFEEGNHYFIVKASGNDRYEPATSEKPVVVTIKRTPTYINDVPLTITDKEYGDTIILSGNLEDGILFADGINGKTINAHIDSVNNPVVATAETSRVLFKDGHFTIEIPVDIDTFDTPGKHNIILTFEGDDDYVASINPTHVNIVKTDTIVYAKLDDHIIYKPDDTATLTIHHLDGYKEIKDDTIEYSVIAVKNGVETLIYEGNEKVVELKATDFVPGTYYLKVKASENYKYKAATSKDLTPLTVLKTNAYINDVPLVITDKEYGDTIILSGNLEDGLLFADGINGKTIKAHIDSADGPVVATAETSKVLFKDGHFVIEIPVDLETFDMPGEHEIILTFDGDDDYNSAVSRTYVKIKRIDTSVTDLEVTPEDTRLWRNDIITVNATLNDELRGEPVEGEKIAFYYVNKFGNTVLMGIGETDEDGIATITYNTRFIPFDGEYDIVAAYYGDHEFKPSYETLDSAFTIHNPEIVSVDVPEEDVLIYGNPELTEAAFDVVFDDFIDRSDNVYYTIYGKDGAVIKSSQEIIGDAGSIIADLSDLDAGDYTIAVIAVDKANGHNEYYWNRADFTIAKADTNLDVTFDNNNVKYSKDNNVITATLTDQFGNPIADKEVTITVESKDGEHKYTYTGTTDENGVFSVTLEPIDFVPSEYTVTASYEAKEDDNYNSCEGASEENLVVNKLDVTFSIEVIDDGYYVIFKLVAKDELGNPVSNEDFTVSLGDEYIGTITTGDDGTGTLRVSKRITGTGKFELNVAFAGNDYLSSASSSNPIVITQSHRGHHRHNGAAVQTGSQNLAILFLVIAIIALALIPMMVYKKRSSRK